MTSAPWGMAHVWPAARGQRGRGREQLPTGRTSPRRSVCGIGRRTGAARRRGGSAGSISPAHGGAPGSQLPLRRGGRWPQVCVRSGARVTGLNRREKARLQYAAARPRPEGGVLHSGHRAGGAPRAPATHASHDSGLGILLHTYVQVEAATILDDATNVRGSRILLNELLRG